MVWNLPKSDGNRITRMPFLTLAGWGLVATSSFVVAFMALQFAQFDEQIVVADAGDPADITGSINAPSKPTVGIMQRGGDPSKPSKTQELSTDVDLLRKELIALRRTVSSIRESRNDLAVRLSLVEKKYEGFTTTLAQARPNEGRDPAQSPVRAQVRADKPMIPSDPLPLTTSTVAEKPDLPPLPPIPVAAPSVKTTVATKTKTKKTATPANATKTPRRVDAPLTTASIPKKTEPEAEPKTIDKTSFGVDLGGFSSLSTLGKGWKDLKQSDQKALIANLAPRASLSDRNGRLEVRLVAGPFDNAAHAVTLCAQLQAKGRPCQPTLFVGQPVVTQ